MKRLRISGTRVGTVLAVVACLGVFLVSYTAYAGISRILPTNDADMQAGGVDGAVDLHLKDLNVAQVTRNKMAAYYPSWDTSSNGKSITIAAGSQGRVCNVNEAALSGRLRIEIRVADNFAAYNVNIDRLCDTGDFYGNTFNFPNGTLIPDGLSDRTKAEITVLYEPNIRLSTPTGSDLNYSMRLTGVNNTIGVLALTKNFNADQFGLRSAYMSDPSAAPNQQVRIGVPFGFPCSYAEIGNGATRTVKLYDADPVFGDTYMWVERDGAKLEQTDYNVPGFGDRIIGWDAPNKRWVLNGSDGSWNTLTLRPSAIIKGAEYKLRVYNPNTNAGLSPHQNTLSVSIPQDSIYSIGDCSYRLRPIIDPLVSQTYQSYPNLRVDGRVDVEEPGPVPEAHPWEIYAVRYPTEPSTRNLTIGAAYTADNPCGATVIPAGASSCGLVATASYGAQPTYTINPYTSATPDPIGTRLCFFARLYNPTDSFDDDTLWAYSLNMKCTISVKKPSFGVTYGDVRTGGSFDSCSLNVTGGTDRHKYFGIVAPDFGGGAQHSYANGAVLSPGTIYNFASLSGGPGGGIGSMRGHFARGPGSPATGGLFYGDINAAPALLSTHCFSPVFKAGRYPNPASAPLSPPPGNATLTPVNNQTTVFKYNIGSGGTLRLGAVNVGATQRIVVRVYGSGTVLLNENINYVGTAKSIQELPQFMLLADGDIDIVVADPVVRLDGIYATKGDFFTCQAYRGVGRVTSNQCRDELKINGSVIVAGRLYPYRTYGHETPADTRTAETFTVRPDVLLSDYADSGLEPGLSISSQRELAPRY